MSDIARDIVKPPQRYIRIFFITVALNPLSVFVVLVAFPSMTRNYFTLFSQWMQHSKYRRTLGRPPSTISREISRNGGLSKYRTILVGKEFLKQARRPKAFLLAENHVLRHIVAEKLALEWSPEQRSGWLKKVVACQGDASVS